MIEQIYTHIKEDNPEFILRIIGTFSKLLDKNYVKGAIESFKCQTTNNKLIAGFDLISNEDISEPLLTFAPDLAQNSNPFVGDNN